jgi:hypothetical protein
MIKNINLENLSEEEAYELCIKLLDKANQDVVDMNKRVNDTLNYCDSLNNFAKRYPYLVVNYLDSNN